MGGASSRYRREMYTGFWRKNVKGTDHLEGLSIDGRILSKWILKTWNGEGMDWIHLAHNRDNWWVRVDTVMKLGVP
jgi:hypothetical protein